MSLTNISEKINFIDQALVHLGPVTPNELAATLVLAHNSDLSILQIQDALNSLSWRSKKELFRERFFCAECSQIIPNRYCRECGLPLPRWLPTALELTPAIPARCDWQLLDALAEILLFKGVDAKKIIGTIRLFNKRIIKPPFLDRDIEQIFIGAGARELSRTRPKI